MSLAPVDTGYGPAKLRLSDHGSHLLRTIKAAKGFASLNEAAEWAAEVAYMALPSADSVDTGKPCSVAPERPEGGPGQGTTRPPAPTNVLEAVPELFLGGVVCSTTWDHPGRWWVGKEGDACCDDHIPDGWVRPGDVVATTLPPACATCGERSEHEVCS